jgi:hypothetical protein
VKEPAGSVHPVATLASFEQLAAFERGMDALGFSMLILEADTGFDFVFTPRAGSN